MQLTKTNQKPIFNKPAVTNPKNRILIPKRISMHKSVLYLSFIFGMISSVLFAQNDCKLRGEVRDSLNLPIFDASVSVFNSKNEGAGFGFTDNEGFFSIDLPCGQDYDVEIEHFDFESYEQKVHLDKSKTLKFKLKKTSITLGEAVIQARKPITVKGDTIEYDADSFRTAADENLEDLLKKLPGLQVENGKVYYEGKEITTIKVGNREVLGGNTKLLTKNLPADAIDKVQLNKKFKANPFSNSLSDDEEAMLNIELKEDKKSLLFGTLTEGGDADKHYDVQSKLFYFSPKTDMTSITDYNTYGKEVFTTEDYFTFLGGFSEFMEDGSSFSIREEPNRISLGTAQNAAEMDAFLSALHFGYEPNKKVFTNGFLLFNYNDLSFQSTQERIGENMNFRDENRNDQRLLSTLGRYRLDYTPNNREQWKYRATFNYLENDSRQFANTFLNDVSTGERDNILKNNSLSFRHNLSYIRKIGSNDNLGIYVRHQFSNQRPDLMITADTVPLVIDSIGFFDLKQNKRLKIQNLQVYGIYNHLITNTSNLRIKIGSNFSWQDLGNKIYESDQLISQNNFLTDSNFDFTELYTDLTYTKKWGAFKLDAGFGLHNFRESTQTKNGSHSLNLTRILPHAALEIKPNNSQNIRLSYNQNYKLPNLTDLSDGYEVENYYSVYSGFLGLKQSLYHNANLSYGYFNSFSFLSFYTGLNYSRIVDNIQSRSDMSVMPQHNSLINNPEKDQTLSFYFGGQKRFSRFYSLSLNSNISYLQYFTTIRRPEFDSGGNMNVVDSQTENSSLSQNHTLTNKFKIKKKIEFDLGLNYSLSNFKSLVDTKFETWRPFGRLAWSISDKFLFQTDYSYNLQYTDNELINKNQALNASLRFHVAKATYLTLIAGNLLGDDRLVSSSFDATTNQTIINTRELLGRYFLAQLRYKF